MKSSHPRNWLKKVTQEIKLPIWCDHVPKNLELVDFLPTNEISLFQLYNYILTLLTVVVIVLPTTENFCPCILEDLLTFVPTTIDSTKIVKKMTQESYPTVITNNKNDSQKLSKKVLRQTHSKIKLIDSRKWQKRWPKTRHSLSVVLHAVTSIK